MRTAYGSNRISLRLAFRPFVDAFQFRGRSTRTEVVCFWLLGVIAHAFSATIEDAPPLFLQILTTGWAILWQWPWVPLLVRRLHDQDRSGWWASLLAGPILVLSGAAWLGMDHRGFVHSYQVGDWLSARTVDWTMATWIVLAGFVACSAVNFILYLLPSSIGPNRYGPDPRLDAEPSLIPAET